MFYLDYSEIKFYLCFGSRGAQVMTNHFCKKVAGTLE